ncbi:MAG: zinc dependent phospholipase C family protein [Microscillaceae bacterium]|nr:zinc dependent phospholipase C family protein [Microscillaceae bacterium]
MKSKTSLLIFLLCLMNTQAFSWGFFAHKLINRMAVFTLPPEMVGFYKFYLTYIEENAVNPDKRRYAVDGEAPRHYIDVDIYDPLYNDSAVFKMPRYWKDAIATHTEDTLNAYGIAPWHIYSMKYRLTEAFRKKDAQEILRLSADLGHYIGDANVPLHTTSNYNGQLTNQIGIHGFWESRLPELYSDNYNFFVGKAKYLENPQLEAWNAVINAHLALDSVLDFERELTLEFPQDKKYTIDERAGLTIRTYARPFCQTYHNKLSGQVERRMRASIKMVGDFWYTCWVDAGQPTLDDLLNKKYLDKAQEEIDQESKQWQENKIKTREHNNEATNREMPVLPPYQRNCCPPDHAANHIAPKTKQKSSISKIEYKD